MFDCNYFWRAISIHSDGSLEPCCHFNAGLEWTATRIKEDNAGWIAYKESKKLTDWNIQNSQTLQKIRKTALGGGVPTGCSPCVMHEKNGMESPRQKGYDTSEEYQPPEEHEKQIIRPVEYIEAMDLFMNNICNFKCIMCSEDFSHLIAKEKNIETPITNWGDNEPHILEFMRKAKNLKKVTIAGGEPFYNTSYLHKVLGTILPRAKNIKLTITTNGSNRITQETADILNQFKEVNLAISIDGTGKYGEVQRSRSDWNVIKENIDYMNETLDTSIVYIYLNSTITAITLPGLPHLLTWAKEHPAINWVHPVFVAYPEWLRCEVLKQEVIDDVKNKVIEIQKENKRWTFCNSPRVTGQIISYLENVKPTTKYREQFDNYFEDLKTKRGLDLYKELPQFKDWLM